MPAPDIAGFLGGGPPAPNPLDQAMGTKPGHAEPDADEYGGKSDSDEDDSVDPEFKDTAAELFPDWPDEDFGKLQKLIDMRVNGAGMGA